jgi:hypothetical protein
MLFTVQKAVDKKPIKHVKISQLKRRPKLARQQTLPL